MFSRIRYILIRGVFWAVCRKTDFIRFQGSRRRSRISHPVVCFIPGAAVQIAHVAVSFRRFERFAAGR